MSFLHVVSLPFTLVSSAPQSFLWQSHFPLILCFPPPPHPHRHYSHCLEHMLCTWWCCLGLFIQWLKVFLKLSIPCYRWSQLTMNGSILWWCESYSYLVESVLRILNFDLSLGYCYAVWPSLSLLKQVVAPSQPRDQEGKQPIHLRPYVPTQPFCFHFQYSIQ